jgi:hypothetical protein
MRPLQRKRKGGRERRKRREAVQKPSHHLLVAYHEGVVPPLSESLEKGPVPGKSEEGRSPHGEQEPDSARDIEAGENVHGVVVADHDDYQHVREADQRGENHEHRELVQLCGRTDPGDGDEDGVAGENEVPAVDVGEPPGEETDDGIPDPGVYDGLGAIAASKVLRWRDGSGQHEPYPDVEHHPPSCEPPAA